MLYDNNTAINYFDNREHFIQEIEKLEKAVEKGKRLKERRDEEEIRRLATQFDHHNYGEKFKIDIDIVLGALLGAASAEKQLSLFGLRKKIKRFGIGGKR